MAIDQVISKTLHLQRTSEDDAVPALWAAGEIERVLGPLTPEQRQSAVLVGWRSNRIEYQHRMSDVEYATARRLELMAAVREAIADGVLTEQERAALAALAAPA